MKYAALTTKHHEGFCLFDSKFTDYKATNTPAHRDLVREYVNAFRAQWLKVGFYYSLLDWHHPDYTMDEYHPLVQTDASQANFDRLNKGRDMAKYRQYLKDQISEETDGDDGKADNVFDLQSTSIRHTQWQDASPQHPHQLVIDLGSMQNITGLKYLPRQDSPNGRIKEFIGVLGVKNYYKG